MLSIGLWRWYINITITILNVIHQPDFYLKHDVSEVQFCLRLQVESTQVGTIEKASLSSPDTSSNTNRVYEANTTQTTNDN
jgi:hypothetical protein